MYNSDYLKQFQAAANVIDFVGGMVVQHINIIEEEMDKLGDTNRNTNEQSNQILYVGVVKSTKDRYLEVI